MKSTICLFIILFILLSALDDLIENNRKAKEFESIDPTPMTDQERIEFIRKLKEIERL